MQYFHQIMLQLVLLGIIASSKS